MLILGLTGSIAMGKSTAAKLLRRLGVPVHDADRAVHAALGRNGAAVAAVERAFPGTTQDGAVDRGKLGACVFGDRAALQRLEVILHPLARDSAERFLAAAARRRERLVVLDVPLLFETGGERRVDATIVVWAPAYLQRLRVMARPGMTEAKFAGIRARQMLDQEKRRRADYTVVTALSRGHSLRQLRRIVRLCRRKRPRRWAPGYRQG